jgi:hypothetical protein
MIFATSNSMEIELPIKTAVVCHDAGAANVVITALMETGRRDWRAYMEGPAKKIWGSVFPEVFLYDSIAKAIAGSKLLVSGTGWASDIEHESRRIAKSKNVKSIAVIDHWVNYTERFVRRGEQVLPDEIWVTDKHALELALGLFPKVPVLQVPNYYLEKQLKGIALLDKPSNPELLYILEPIRSNWNRNIPGEFQALEYFISKFPLLEVPKETVICLRPHPSDLEGKYNDWIKSHSDMNIKLDDSISITESLGRASWVAGCESFALVLALFAGRTVYCTLPPWAPICRLPHSGIIQLRELSK